MTFLAQAGRVHWITEGGSYALTADEIETLLAIFDREHAVREWLDLDQAAQDAGYPPNTSSLRAIRRAQAA